jgi:uncharacterized membrane protein
MSKGRLEAFSDGVIAIIITIMVLELQVPHGTALADLAPLLPVFLSYVLSFVFLGIYWNNHHHLMHAAHHVNGRVLWANMFLLFWLSLIPFVTAWMGENGLAAWPVALYGAVCWMSGLAYYNLSRTIIASEGKESVLATAVGRDFKGILSLVFYTVAILLAFLVPWLAVAIYVVTALMWFIPDQRIEKRLAG